MKKLLGAIVLSMAFFFEPIQAVKKETTEHVKSKKADIAKKKKVKEKKAATKEKVNKPAVKSPKKEKKVKSEKVEKPYLSTFAAAPTKSTPDHVVGKKGRWKINL